MTALPDTGSRAPDYRDPPPTSPDTGPSPDTGERRRRRRGRWNQASAPPSPEELARRERMAQDQARAVAYREARSARAQEADQSDRLRITSDHDGDEEIVYASVRTIDGRVITLQELFGASAEVEMRLPTVPKTRGQRLEMVRRILAARSEGTPERNRTDNERKIAASEEAFRGVAEAVSQARANRTQKFKEKRAAVLGAETKYLETLKDAKEAFLEEFRAASSSVNEQVGVHLESLLGVKEPDVERYFDAWMRKEGRNAIAPWELPEDELKHLGYKNRVTGEYEDAVPWRAQDWKDDWKMFWKTRENNQNQAVRRKLGYAPWKHRSIRVAAEVGHLMSTGLFNVAGFGTAMVLGGKAIWRSTVEPLAYWGVRGLAKIIAGGLEPFGVKGNWADRVWKEPPWKKRGDWPFVGPVMNLFRAVKRGTPWGEKRSATKEQSSKKKE